LKGSKVRQRWVKGRISTFPQVDLLFLKRVRESSASLEGREEQCLDLFRVLVLGLLVDNHLFREVMLEGQQD
jgi:hypothetical protein